MTPREELLARLEAERFTPIPTHRVLPAEQANPAQLEFRRVHLDEVLHRVDAVRAIPCRHCGTPPGPDLLAPAHRPTCPHVLEALL